MRCAVDSFAYGAAVRGEAVDPHAAVSGADYAEPDAFIGTQHAAGRGCHGQAGRHLSGEFTQ